MSERKPDHLEALLERIPELAPVTMIVPLQGTLAVALFNYAMESGIKAETVMAEALRAYLGDFK